MNDRPEDSSWSRVRFLPTKVCNKSAQQRVLFDDISLETESRRMWRKAVPAHLDRTASAVLTVGCGRVHRSGRKKPTLNSE